MDLKLVKKFINLAKKEGVESLSIDDGEMKLSVKLPSAAMPVSVQPTVVSAPVAQMPSASKADAVKSDPNIIEVTAPVVGTFYASASPGEPSFAKVGDKVSKGKTLCIIEAMKIMNEIESDVDGEVVEVCIENEEFVEFGQVLFKIKKS